MNTDQTLPIDWSAIAAALDISGCAVVGPVFTPETCAALAAVYDSPSGFRSRVVMARHGFGQGEYRYFDYPLPTPVQTLREQAYAALAPVANA